MDPILTAVEGFSVALLVRIVLRDLARRRRLKRTPVTPIGRSREKVLVVVTGVVGVAADVLRAPLSGRECVAYELEVAQDSPDGRQQLYREARSRSFLLRDDTGKAFVAIEDASLSQVHLQHGAVERPGDDTSLPTEIRAILGRPEVAAASGFMTSPLRVVERAIVAGSRARVRGVGWWEPDPSPDPGSVGSSYRTAPRQLRISSSRDVSLTVADAANPTADQRVERDDQ